VVAGGLTHETLDQAHTAVEVAQARADAARKRVAAAQSALAASKQQRDAAVAQTDAAGVRLAYTEVRAPSAGIVDVRAVRVGEVVTAGEPIVTLVDPDDLWVRADVEESYIDRIRLGDTLTVRLPSGEERTGTVFYRGVDAGYATQRDVSRTKRDIKTFEVRLRVDNSDRRLALGMTAYVLLPTSKVAS
jgi:HlyD family secretion protein